MLEKDFQSHLKHELTTRFPGCLVLKQDPNMRQGIPDLLVLYEDRWAALETKRLPKSKRQPNQEYYVDKMGDMSYSAFVNPENIDEVLRDLQSAFRRSG